MSKDYIPIKMKNFSSDGSKKLDVQHEIQFFLSHGFVLEGMNKAGEFASLLLELC